MTSTTMRRVRGGLLLGMVGATAAACGGAPQPPAATAGPVDAIPAWRVTTGPGDGWYRAPGVVRSEQRADISTRMAGRVETVRVRPGDRVKAGQVLVTLDGIAIDASVDQVTAGLELATNHLRRMERLFADSAVPLVQLEQARTNHAQAAAQARAATAERRYATLTAPFAGTVSARLADPGDLATPGRPLVSIEGDGPKEIVLAVPEAVAGKLARGRTVTVRIGSEEQPIEAKVAAVVPAADPMSRTIEVRLTTAAPVTPNLTAVADLPAAGQGGHPLVPRAAVAERGQLTGVYLFAPDSTLRLRWVRLGRPAGEMVEVLSGLADGDIVAKSAATARDGSRARPALGGTL